MRKLSTEEANFPNVRKWYLLHFGVINPNMPKKVRIVFDAAAEVNGVPLHSNHLKGPLDI